jgi:hypothetical protein
MPNLSLTPSKPFRRLLLIMAVMLFAVWNQSAFAQYGTPCSTCEENRHNCYVDAEWAYQACRRDGGDESQCENGRQTTLQNCDYTYQSCSATCDPGGVNPNPTPQTGCRDNGVGALTSLESNGYLSGWAQDGDAPSYNQTIAIHFYVDRQAGFNTVPDFGVEASLIRPPGGGHGFSAVIPARYRDGQWHVLYGYTSDPCYGLRHFWQGSPQWFLLTPGNPIDDHRTFVRQLFIDYYRREPDQSSWDYWTNYLNACGGDTGCSNDRRGYVAATLFESNEYATFGAVPEITWLPKGSDAYDEAFVRALYRTMLRRDAESIGQSEIDAWVNVLNAYGQPTPQAGYNAVADGFIRSIEYRNRFF